MARAFCIPGILILFCALATSFLASVSLPYLPGLDICRTHFDVQGVQAGQVGITEIRVSYRYNLLWMCGSVSDVFALSMFPQFGVWYVAH